MHPISSPLQVLHFPHTLIINQNTSIQAVYKPFFFFFSSVHDQSLSKYLGLSWPDFTLPFCLCKHPKLRQLRHFLHLTGPCTADTGVPLKAHITLPSADIYCMTSFTLGNMRHMAEPMLGTACWKLSVEYTTGSEQCRVEFQILLLRHSSFPTNVYASTANMGSMFGSLTKALNPQQIDSPKVFQSVCCASTLLDRCAC